MNKYTDEEILELNIAMFSFLEARKNNISGFEHMAEVWLRIHPETKEMYDLFQTDYTKAKKLFLELIPIEFAKPPEYIHLEKVMEIFTNKDSKEETLIDVTVSELCELQNHKLMQPIISGLEALWVGDSIDRRENVRVGTIKFYRDSDGLLHLDLTCRF